MIGYKLTTQALTTYNNCRWQIGVKRTAEGAGGKPCTDGVLHYYESPYHAALFNPIHAAISAPILWRIECSRRIGADGLKSWCKSQTLLERVALPEITTDQRVEFAIRCAMQACEDKDWRDWAEKWLSGADRSADAADVALAAAAAAAAALAAAAAAAAAADAADVAKRAGLIGRAITETFNKG